MYGSNFCIVTLYPLALSSFPKEAAIIPFPNEEVTPPVTKIYFVENLFKVIFFTKIVFTNHIMYWVNLIINEILKLKCQAHTKAWH